MNYKEQRKTFEEAIKLGWKGKIPSVLGTYAADKTLNAAISEIKRVG